MARGRQSHAPASCSDADQQVPVSFLTAEQERRYGRYAGEPSTDQLARHFHLDDADRDLATAKRWDHMRLGFAVQLGTVRFLGTFLDDPVDVPTGVSSDMARQLGIADPACLAMYREGRVRWQHAREIRAGFGYREFTDPFVRFRLARWLYALCWTGTDRPSVLFDRATAWLVTEKVLLPGASALERLVARIRAGAARRLWRTLTRDVTREQRTQLDALLVASDGGRPSPLDRLRDGPYLRSGAELSRAVGRLDEVRQGDPRHPRQLRGSQAPQCAGLARRPSAMDLPLHANLVLLLSACHPSLLRRPWPLARFAQRRRGLLLKAHPAEPQTRRLPFRPRPRNGDHPIHRRHEQKPQTIRLDRNRQGDCDQTRIEPSV